MMGEYERIIIRKNNERTKEPLVFKIDRGKIKFALKRIELIF